MKVLFFTEHVALSRFWADTVRTFREREVEVAFATLREHEQVHASIRSLGVPAYALGTKTARSYPLAAARLYRILRAHKIDVLHTAEIISASVAGLIPRVLYDCQRVFRWGGSWGVWQRNGDRIGPRLFWWANHTTDLVMASSAAAAQDALRQGQISPARVRVAHNGVAEPREVPERELMELRKHLGIAPEAAVISAVARLRAEKGIDVLIDALPTVERLIRCPVWLLIVGEGHEAPRLRAKAALTAADRIRFLGGAADVTPWFQIADVVAVPSLFEPFGLSALEAIASRRPIVASRVGGLPEFIEHGKTGTLVPPGDPVALADGLASTLASADLAQRMAQAAYRVYRERFTSDIMVDAWLEHYRELLGPKQMSRAHS